MTARRIAGSLSLSLLLLLSLLLTSAACSSESEEPDASVEPFACEEPGSGVPPTEDFQLAFGYDDQGAFVEINDSDRTPVVLGRQGFYMIVAKLRADQALPADSFCLRCRQQVGPIDTFDGIDYEAGLFFRRDDASDFYATSFLVMGGDNLGEILDGAMATITVTCTGHGVSGTVERIVELYLAGDFASP